MIAGQKENATSSGTAMVAMEASSNRSRTLTHSHNSERNATNKTTTRPLKKRARSPQNDSKHDNDPDHDNVNDHDDKDDDDSIERRILGDAYQTGRDMTTAQGQLSLNPFLSMQDATKQAKREYQRQNAARNRVKHKRRVQDLEQQLATMTQRVHELEHENQRLEQKVKVLEEKEQQQEQQNRTRGDSSRTGNTNSTTITTTTLTTTPETRTLPDVVAPLPSPERTNTTAIATLATAASNRLEGKGGMMETTHNPPPPPVPPTPMTSQEKTVLLETSQPQQQQEEGSAQPHPPPPQLRARSTSVDWRGISLESQQHHASPPTTTAQTTAVVPAPSYLFSPTPHLATTSPRNPWLNTATTRTALAAATTALVGASHLRRQHQHPSLTTYQPHAAVSLISPSSSVLLAATQPTAALVPPPLFQRRTTTTSTIDTVATSPLDLLGHLSTTNYPP